MDNFTISTITNGLYGDEYYCIYLHPVLCTIIYYISVLLPTADAFLLLGHLFIVFETVWLLYLSLIYPERRLHRISFIAFSRFNVIDISLYNTIYTVQGASFFFTGWLTLFLQNNQEKQNRIYGIIGIVFIILGTMWRVKATLLFIPFVALELLISLLEFLQVRASHKRVAR